MKITTKELTLTAMFAALMIVGAFIKIDIPLPLYTMHFTLQWLFVLLAGLLLGSKLGALSVIVYLALGLIGLPVFAAGGGIGYILRPGFGFLLGFAFAAYLMGLICEKAKSNSFPIQLLAATVGLIVYYTVGAIYFYMIKNFYAGDYVTWPVVIVQYCLITVIPDFILCVLAVTVSAKVRVPFRAIIER